MKKISLIFFVLLITMAFVITPETNPTLRYIKGQIRQLTNAKQFENLYLQTDKPLYEQGETVWFSAFVRHATDFKNAESEIVYVELINPKGAIVVKRNLLMENVAVTGDFQITDDFVGGIYKIKAYTKWMQDVQKEAFTKEITIQDVVLPNLLMDLNFQRKAYGKGDKAFANLELKTLKNQPLANTKIKCSVLFDGINNAQFFQKTDENGKAIIQVNLPIDLTTNDGLLNVMIDYEGQIESISRPIPIILGDIDVQFLPESGNLLANTKNNIAFKAVNEFGKAADIEGAIYNKKNEIVTYFSSYHLGMGKLELEPQKDEKYYAKILSPRGIDKKYELPEIDKENCIVQINDFQSNEIDLTVISNLNKTLYVLLENRGEVIHTEAIKPTKIPQYQFKIPTDNLPIGMSRITVIDEKYNALAQRLVFLNQDKQLDISVKTDKELYLPRENVKAKITVKDHNGNPVQGNFVMSVADENLLKLADDKQCNILSQMLLQSDLKGEIEEPNFYFEKQLATDKIDRQKALDLLMMTQGWRRYEWSKIRTAPVKIHRKKEQKIIAGKVIDINGNLDKTTIEVEGTGVFTKVDYNGHFELKNVDLYEPKTLILKKRNQKLERKITVNRYRDDLELYFLPIEGRIWDENTEEPIPFANIFIEGQKIGVTTDFDGKFDLQFLLQEAAKLKLENPVFRIQYIGYNTAKFTLEDLEKSNKEIFDIYIGENNMVLESVVIGARGSRNTTDRQSREVKMPKKSRSKKNRKSQSETKKPAEKGKVNISKFSKISNEKNDENSIAEITATDVVYYYKPRTFKSPKYKTQKPKTRTDFQTTIYWNGNVQTDKNGVANVEFTNVDAITTYRITVEGFGQNGDIGFHQNNLVSSMPFALKLKLPTHLTDGDLIDLPITLVNNSDKKISGKLKIDWPSNLKKIERFEVNQTLKSNEAKTVFIKCQAFVPKVQESEFLKVSFKNGEWNDAIERKIEVKNNGFPVNMTFADANVMEKSYTFEINEPMENSANISLKLMPTVLNQVFNDLENMIRQPYGCFEQTSSSNYPNILALQYMREMDKTNPKIEAKALKYLTEGYKKLTSFECKNGGFEWFGNDPAHEGLTAYGLMQFVDMQEVFPVSSLLINRTAKWLLSRRDENGGWQMNERSLHSWAASPEIFNAYITWAVSEAGYVKKINNELDKTYSDAIKTEDVYVMALAANALLNAKDKRGKELLADIELRQNDNGSWDGLKHSIVYSKGQDLTVETTSLVMLAMMKDNRFSKKLRKANDFLMKSRNSYGFGNTQSTVMALKAIIEYAKNAQKPQKGGQVAVYLNGDNIGNFTYSENQTKDVFLNNLVSNLPKGQHEITVKFTKTKTPIPFQINLNYATTLPLNDKYQQVDLTTTLTKTSVKQGETIRYQIKIKNVNNINRNNPIAIVGMPAGTSPQIWQLKKLQKEGIFDYYEIFDGYLVFYYRTIKSVETKTINLDLKAEVKGKFSAPASSACLYYMSEYKTWTKAETLEIL